MEVTGGIGFFSFLSFASEMFSFMFGVGIKRMMLMAFILRFVFYMYAVSLRDVGFEGAKGSGISLFISTLKKLYFINTMRV